MFEGTKSKISEQDKPRKGKTHNSGLTLSSDDVMPTNRISAIGLTSSDRPPVPH